jgi:hypothetical protein
MSRCYLLTRDRPECIRVGARIHCAEHGRLRLADHRSREIDGVQRVVLGQGGPCPVRDRFELLAQIDACLCEPADKVETVFVLEKYSSRTRRFRSSIPLQIPITAEDDVDRSLAT